MITRGTSFRTYLHVCLHMNNLPSLVLSDNWVEVDSQGHWKIDHIINFELTKSYARLGMRVCGQGGFNRVLISDLCGDHDCFLMFPMRQGVVRGTCRG